MFSLHTGTCLVYLIQFAKTTNITIPHDRAAQEATAFAIQIHDNYKRRKVSLLAFIQYAYPICQWEQAMKNILDAASAPNTLWPYHTLSGPLNRKIVGPNADTLYIWMAVDLSPEDLVLTIPNISDGRNRISPFYDVSFTRYQEHKANKWLILAMATLLRACQSTKTHRQKTIWSDGQTMLLSNPEFNKLLQPNYLPK